MNRSRVIPVIFILAAAVMWGYIGVFIRHLNAYGLTSAQITTIRCLVNAVLMFLLILVTDKSRLRVRPRDIGLFLANGICSIYVFYSAYQASITRTSMPTAVALLYTAPVFVLILSAILFSEKITAVKGLSAVLSVVGSALVSGILGGVVADAGGIGLGLLSGLGYALYSIFSVMILKKYHAFTNILYSFLAAGILGLFTCNVREMGAAFSREPASIGWALSCGVVTAFLSYLFYTVGLTRVRASQAAIYASIEPVVATLIGVLVYHEALGAGGVAGICMVIGAILLMNSGIGFDREKSRQE